MNPVLILTHNNLDLTKKCVDSIIKQDTDCWVHAIDNDSSDGSYEWLKGSTLGALQFSPQIGVSAGWNVGLNNLFNNEGAEHVLVLNNDTILPTFFYRELLAYNLPFVSGRETTTLSDLDLPFEQGEYGGGPQFSCFLIRKDAWEKIGPFDETMWGWCSDCDYHIRAHRLGIRLLCSPVRYYHERSSTIETALPKEKRQLQMQADADRLMFAQKYGFRVFDPQYTAMFDEKLFGIDAK